MAGLGDARSARVEEVVRWFGLDRGRGQVEDVVTVPAVREGQIVYITGASGAGKSRLLGRMREEAKRRAGERANGREEPVAGSPTRPLAASSVRWIDLHRIPLPRSRALVDCFPGRELTESLEMLSRVGLAEAWDWVRTPGDLSDGQRFRLRIALGLWHATQMRRKHTGQLTVLACDEFCAILDRITARVVARTLRRTIDRIPHLAAIVVTSHDDLTTALQPDTLVTCDFGKTSIRTPDARARPTD